MSGRERFLAIVLVVAILLVAGAFLGYQFVYSPYVRHTESIAKLRQEVEKLQADKEFIETQQFVYENKTRKMSLPADTAVAQIQYRRLLDDMLSHARFTSPTIVPHKEDSKTDVPVLSGKKPAYTKLSFDVTATGDLLSIVDFLYSFYRQPILHKVVKINISKPTTVTGRDLSLKLTVQAIALERAENRKLALAAAANTTQIGFVIGAAAALPFKTVEPKSDVLARANNYEYRRIAGKNIFFDPPKAEAPKKEEVVEKKEEKEPVAKEPDLGPYLGLVRVSHSDGKSTALIFDRFNKHDYEIETNGTGLVKVTHFWYLANKEENGFVSESRKKFTERPFLQFGSKEGGNLRQYVVHRILESELLLETYDETREKLMRGPAPLALGGTASLMLPGKLHVWRIGQMLTSEDSKHAMKDLNYSWTKRDALLRPLSLENEGNGQINFTGQGDAPPDPKKADPTKKGTGTSPMKKGTKGSGGKTGNE